MPYVEPLTFYRLFGWGMRQITGYMEDYWAARELGITAPSFGHLSDLFAALDVKVTQRCERLTRRLTNGEDVSLIIDRTGMSASEWYEQKYGKTATKTPWRKMHLSIDVDMNVHAIAITGTDVSDSEWMERVLPADLPVDRVIADGAYYSIERAEELPRSGVLPRYSTAFSRCGPRRRTDAMARRGRWLHQGKRNLCISQEIRLWEALAG